MPPSADLHPVERFVEACRRRGRAQIVRAAVIDVLIAWAATTLGAVPITAATDRGDWVRIAWLLVLAVIVAVRARAAAEQLKARFADTLTTARTVARIPGPLGTLAVSHRQRLLGALELRALSHTSGPVGTVGHLGSRSLAKAEADAVATALERAQVRPEHALPSPPSVARRRLSAVLLVCATLMAFSPAAWNAAATLALGIDARPPAPRAPVWTFLRVGLTPPEYSGRPPASVDNPSGTLRALAGTRVEVELHASAAAQAVTLAVTQAIRAEAAETQTYECAQAPAPTDAPAHTRWRCAFVVVAATTWNVAVREGGIAGGTEVSVDHHLDIDADAPPNVELEPLDRRAAKIDSQRRVGLRVSASDDFGLQRADLVFVVGDEPEQRLQIAKGTPGARSWRYRFDWDLAEIPIERESEVELWIEVRDNDPGLGPDGPFDPIGKVGRSARQRLLVDDRQAAHARNILDLVALRDQGVDLLARRLTTTAFGGGPSPVLDLLEARELHGEAAGFLAAIVSALDALALDGMARDRDVETLAAIHARLLELHGRELTLHEALGPGSESFFDDADLRARLAPLGPHNAREVTQLEDEIIRIDDLVDGMIIAEIEALLARLEASQRRLIELLEQLAAGDESVRPRVEQLERRIRDDLRRLAEARALLGREVGQEFINIDALRALERQMERMGLQERLGRDDVEGALEAARQRLDEMRGLREKVQQSAESAQNVQISPEQRARMKLLRELGRLADEEARAQAETSAIHQRWREQVESIKAGDPKRAAKAAKDAKEALEAINDARLGREAREAYQDALDALESLSDAAGDQGERPSQLALAEKARQAAGALSRAQQGAEDAGDRKALDRAQRAIEGLAGELEGGLPRPADTLSAEDRQALERLTERQSGMRDRLAELSRDEAMSVMPAEGGKAMQEARDGMQRASKRLSETAPRPAMGEQQGARDAIQRAIDALRQSSPPPPAGSSGGESSTEAERDRTLRDEVMEAMREDVPDAEADAVERYYRELLR